MIKTAIPVGFMILAGAALAHEGAHGIVSERMNAMKDMQQEMKAIGEMLVGKVPFDRVSLEEHAKALHENCHMIGDMFPPGSADPRSHAKPSIWKDRETFATEVKRLHEASGSFLSLAQAADKQKLLASLKTISIACDSCHESFRKPVD
jgi:cytochrome c556